MTSNAGSGKKYPLSGSWDYKEVIRELDRQSSKKRIHVQVGDQIYILKNPYHEGPYELGDKLADQIYESIRESDTDICDIAQNLGFKADNIKNVKDHVFIMSMILSGMVLIKSNVNNLILIFNKL